MDRGARSVYAAGVHPVLSGPAIERISASQIEKVMVTDTLALSEEARRMPEDRAAVAGRAAR